MKRICCAILLLTVEASMAVEFPPEVPAGMPVTAAEKSGYLSTTLYADVMAFIAAMQQRDPDIRVETFGMSGEGRELPLVILGPDGGTTPESSRRSGLPVVFIMANIHAGEVEGKEAALMLLRDLCSTRRKLRRDMTILIAPIYNADGNEAISISHRTTQNGPLNGVGQRENAQGLDLNRDYMKLESPEARGLVQNVLARWDPLVTVDLHTTNGSYHGYSLTYSPPLNPNVPEDIVAFERETLLPWIREQMSERYGQKTYYYGNFVNQLEPEKGWYTFDSRPRFGNNYVGLRGRFAILSEAYSYIDFRSRIKVTYEFLHPILEAVDGNSRKMMKIAARADARVAAGKLRKSGVRFEIAPWKEKVEILWEKSDPATASEGSPDPETGHDPETGRGLIKRTGQIVPMRMTDFGVFQARETAAVPYAYLLSGAEVVDNLQTHGIVVETLTEDTQLTVEDFVIASAEHAEQAFQNHHELTLTGKWKERKDVIPRGTHLVRMEQPLARLAFYLLEPRSDDGLFAWNFFDSSVSTGERKVVAPVRKLMKKVPLEARIMQSAVGSRQDSRQ